MVSPCLILTGSWSAFGGAAACSAASCSGALCFEQLAHDVVAINIMAAIKNGFRNSLLIVVDTIYFFVRFFLKKSVISFPHSSARTFPVTMVLG